MKKGALQKTMYGVSAVLLVVAALLALLDVDGWPQYSTMLIGAATAGALRTYYRLREYGTDD